MSESNGKAARILSKEDLADRSRFQFKQEVLELPELDGAIVIKTLSVDERESLPDLRDENDKPDVTTEKLAAIFAAVVEEPKLTAEEAEEFIGDWPADALDKVIEKFGDLSGDKNERSAAASTFPEDE